MSPPHSRPIRILHLEDSPQDAELIRTILAAEGPACDLVQVNDAEGFAAALDGGSFDLILTDYNIPRFNGLAALRLARAKQPAVPVIVISGSLGEQEAVKCLQLGAIDYLLKQKLDRLVSAVNRALLEAEEQQNRRRAEAALQESEERFRQLAETIEDVFWSASPDYRTLIYVSPAYARVWGRSLAELLANPEIWIGAIRGEDRPRVGEARAGLAAGVAYEIEFRIERPDGGPRWILDRGFPLRTAGGAVYRVVGVARDITRQKLAEEARRLSEARFVAIFHSSPVPIGYGTMEERILDANPQLCEFSGYSREEMVGRTALELGLWADPEERRVAMEAVRRHKGVRNQEMRLRRKTGEIRSALLSLEVLQFTDEPLLLVMLIDITERKALEAQLHRAHRVESVGRLSSGIAHDMNNILAPIMMAAPLLRMGLSPADAEKTLATIETSAQRGAALIRQLMIFGRGVEGERRPVRPAEIVAEITRIAGQTFPRNITITTRIPPDIWPVRGDATQLHQVMLNLCVNARDVMPEGGVLIVSAENVEIDAPYAAIHSDAQPGRYVLIRVADTGAGIPPEIMDRIFDPFFTTKEVGKGTGLGLSTVIGIVKSHGGFVRLQSEVGRGTTFDIYLPASFAGGADPAPASVAVPMRGCGELIMIVDDEAQIRSVLRETLERHNYKVVTAQDGVEAIAVFAANNNANAELVITDLDMPLMDGVNLARVLRRMNPTVKIVVSTGLNAPSGADKRRAELAELGITTILTKPYTADKILNVINDLVAHKKA